MEKQTAAGSWKRRRFLKYAVAAVFALFSANAFTQNNVRISWDYVRSLTCKPASEYFFTNQDCAFNLDIEGINPEDITLSVNRLPDNVNYITFKKETLNATETERSGTRVILWFRFYEEGDYQIPPVNVTIGRGMYSIKFEPVTVYTNPRTIQPKVSIEFANEDFRNRGRSFTVTSGQHIIFTVNLQYATQLINLKWGIPEDSLFREIQRFDVAKKGIIDTNFSPDVVPVVTFDWQPLVPGVYNLPKMIITVSSYSGGQLDLTLPDYKFTVLGVTQSSDSDQSLSVYDEFQYAFETPAVEKPVEETHFVEIKNLDELYRLRVKERHSLPVFTRARQNRIEAETAAGLKPGLNESSLILHYVICGILILLVIGVIILFITKRMMFGSIVLACSLVFATLSIFSGIACGMKYGLFKGGYVNTIPEEFVNSGVTLQSGTRVKIEHHAKGWVFIRSNDTSGWVKEDSVLIIR